MKIAAAYIRVSTDDQIEYSPDSQLKAIQNYAEKNGFYLPEQHIFIDEGISGRTIGKREGFKKMIALAKSTPTPFNTILVWKYSRFARNREDSVVYKSMLKKQCGINVVSISESTGDDKMSILFEAMIEAMDEYYSINLSEEVKRGMTEKARRGEALSIPPFGYKIVDGEFVILEPEATMIRDVFEGYASGRGFLSLAKKMNALGVKTHRGNKIESRTIEYWLNNPVYTGKIRWNPVEKTSRDYNNKNLIISEGTHEPIIDDALWNAVQKKLKENKAYYKNRIRHPRKGLSHWLTGVLRCGKCGCTLSYSAGHYYCSAKKKGLCEGNGGVSVNVISKIVIDKFKEILDTENVQLQFDTSKNATSESSSDTIKLIQIQIDECSVKLERIKKAYENGIDTLEEYKINKTNITNELNNLKNILSEEQSQVKTNSTQTDSETTKILRENISKISEILADNQISTEVKNGVIKSIVKEIVKTGDDGRTFQIVFWDPTE